MGESPNIQIKQDLKSEDNFSRINKVWSGIWESWSEWPGMLKLLTLPTMLAGNNKTH